MDSPLSDVPEWSTFPIDDNRRPLILLQPRTNVRKGFTDDEAKLAWAQGRVVVTASVPQAVAALLPERRDFGGPTPAAVELTAARRAAAAFRTDRGPRELPVWQLTGPQLLGSCTVLDPEVPVWWPSPEHEADFQLWLGEAWVEADGLTVHLPASGGFNTEFLRAEFTEHRTYVVGHPITREPPPSAQFIPAVGRTGHVVGRLASPLGDRVLVDGQGHPIAVTAPPAQHHTSRVR